MKEFVDSLEIIIVLYNTLLEESESFRSLRQMEIGKGTLALFIYDNSKRAQTIQAYEGMNIFYGHDPQNPGVSKAYNAGAAHARKHQKKWVLLLDQDTTLPPILLKSFWRATVENLDLKLFAPILELENGKIFSPCRYRFKKGFHVGTVQKGVHSLQRLSPVNSGMLVDVAAFVEVGGYNETVKLDFSDFQFIERFRRYHPDFYVMGVKCQQDFSDGEISLAKQTGRFGYYCEGARNTEKHGFWDWFQYNAVIFFRALRLATRYKNLRFFRIYFDNFLFPKRVGT